MDESPEGAEDGMHYHEPVCTALIQSFLNVMCGERASYRSGDSGAGDRTGEPAPPPTETVDAREASMRYRDDLMAGREESMEESTAVKVIASAEDESE